MTSTRTTKKTIMKKFLAVSMFIALLGSCSKKETPAPAVKTYSVEYKLELTSAANATVAGTVSYISKSSPSATSTLASPSWVVTESNWALKSGDSVGFKANITNAGSYKAFLLVDGGVMKYQSTASTFPINGTVTMYYTIP